MMIEQHEVLMDIDRLFSDDVKMRYVMKRKKRREKYNSLKDELVMDIKKELERKQRTYDIGRTESYRSMDQRV